MSIKPLEPTKIEMSQSRKELTTTTFERAFFKEFGQGLGTRIWLAVFGTLFYGHMHGAKTHKEEREAIDLLNAKLQNLVSHMPRPITDTKIAALLGRPAAPSNPQGNKDTSKLTTRILPEFSAALQNRVEQLAYIYPEKHSQAEQQAALHQAAIAEVDAGITEHNKTWYKPGTITDDIQGWKKVLARQSIATLGDYVTIENLGKNGYKAVADHPFAVHILTFGLDKDDQYVPLMRKTQNEIVKKWGKACGTHLAQLSTTDHVDQEIQRRIASRKEPIEREIAKRTSYTRSLRKQLTKEMAIQEGLLFKKNELTEKLEYERSRLEKLANKPKFEKRLLIERFVRENFKDEELGIIHDAIYPSKANSTYQDHKPDIVIQLCRKQDEILSKIDTVLCNLDDYDENHDEHLMLLNRFRSQVSKSVLYNEDTETSAKLLKKEKIETRNLRNSIQANISQLEPKIESIKYQIKNTETNIAHLNRKIEFNQQKINEQSTLLSQIDNTVRKEVLSEPHPSVKPLAEARKAAIRKEIPVHEARIKEWTTKLERAQQVLEDLPAKREKLVPVLKALVSDLEKLPKLENYNEFADRLLLENVVRLQFSNEELADIHDAYPGYKPGLTSVQHKANSLIEFLCSDQTKALNMIDSTIAGLTNKDSAIFTLTSNLRKSVEDETNYEVNRKASAALFEEYNGPHNLLSDQIRQLELQILGIDTQIDETNATISHLEDLVKRETERLNSKQYDLDTMDAQVSAEFEQQLRNLHEIANAEVVDDTVDDFAPYEQPRPVFHAPGAVDPMTSATQVAAFDPTSPLETLEALDRRLGLWRAELSNHTDVYEQLVIRKQELQIALKKQELELGVLESNPNSKDPHLTKQLLLQDFSEEELGIIYDAMSSSRVDPKSKVNSVIAWCVNLRSRMESLAQDLIAEDISGASDYGMKRLRNIILKRLQTTLAKISAEENSRIEKRCDDLKKEIERSKKDIEHIDGQIEPKREKISGLKKQIAHFEKERQAATLVEIEEEAPDFWDTFEDMEAITTLHMDPVEEDEEVDSPEPLEPFKEEEFYPAPSFVWNEEAPAAQLQNSLAKTQDRG